MLNSNSNVQDDNDDGEVEITNMNENENDKEDEEENESNSSNSSNSDSSSDSDNYINNAKNTINDTRTNKIANKIYIGININITESPYWPDRAFHIHTQHPLELTDVLQGHDIPQFGPHGSHCSVFSYNKKQKYTRRNKNKKHNGNFNMRNNYNNQDHYGGNDYDSNDYRNYHDHDDNDGNSDDNDNYYNTIINQITNNIETDLNNLDDDKELKNKIIKEQNKIKKDKKYKIQEQAEIDGKLRYCERWEDMVDDVSSLFEWAVANRLNKIEWLLLGNYKWGDELETRAKRLLFFHFFMLSFFLFFLF